MSEYASSLRRRVDLLGKILEGQMLRRGAAVTHRRAGSPL